MTHWTILTCEYPPDCGGVGDYTAQVAAALAAAGDTVTVFCPPRTPRAAPETAITRDSSTSQNSDASGGSATSRDSWLPPSARRLPSTAVDMPGVELVMLDDVYGRHGRRTIDERLSGASSGARATMLVQYVPTGFGLRGANIPWCRWLLERSRRPGNDVRVMFHEPYFEYTWSPIRQNVLAVAERLMAKLLLRAANRVYLSTDAWHRYLAPYAAAGQAPPFVTLPIPAAIPRCERGPEIAARRRLILGESNSRVVGHFGTFGSEIAPMLRASLIELLSADATLAAVCVGSGSDEFARSLAAAVPALRGRAHGTGRLPAAEAALVLSACDLLVQPYPDGVTTRRTSIMAGLINARAIVTTTGHLTEPVWAETGAVALAPARDMTSFAASARALLATDADRLSLAARGERAYRERFALAHTIGALRGTAEGAAA